MNKPKFIVFEGLDGAGKSTQIEKLRQRLEATGIRCVTTAEPTELPSGKELRRALRGEIRKSDAEMAILFAADRENHNTDEENGILAALNRGFTVISDRYYYSSLAYQGAALGYDAVAELNLKNPLIRTPDVCVFLDLSPSASLERIGNRGEVKEIYENKDYLTKTRNMFFDVFERLGADGENIAVIDASGSIESVADAVFNAVYPLYR